MMNSNLTIIIPVHRNDDRLQKAIESAQWAKLLLIDQQSGIDWNALRTHFTFDLIEHSQLTDFSEMRNNAMKVVTTDWMFFLDSDELISKDLEVEIQKAISNSEIDAFKVKRIDIFLGKKLLYGETKTAQFLRGIRKDKGVWQGGVHEVLNPVKDAKVITLNNSLLHTPQTSIHEFIGKINLYTSLLAKQPEGLVILKELIFPVGKFLYTFFIKLGFLDGYRGLIYSFIMSLHSSIVRIKRYELQQQ